MALALSKLPQDIQQRIILSLPPKAFARSSVLSKSWLSFYNSTGCRFDFTFHCDAYDPRRAREVLLQEIMNFNKSLSDSLLREKLTVEEFNINMKLDRFIYISKHGGNELKDVVYKWLAALFTTNNIVKVLRIQIPTLRGIGNFYMPPEIFSNESLQILHLEHNCILGRVHARNLGCLRVLSLCNVSIDGESTNRILTACPILEQLIWKNNFEGQHIIIKGLHKLKDLEIWGLADVRIQEAPALENVSLILDEYDDPTIINSRLCRRIRILEMSVNSERTATHIQQIVSCLPELENLNLTMLCATDIRISSSCLKNLTLFISEDEDQYLRMVKINAPNLRSYEYGSNLATFSRHLMMKTGMLEMVMILLMNIEIYEPRHVLELRKALRMIEHLKLRVDTVKLVNSGQVCVKASRLDQKLNVSATRVIEMLDAGAVEFNVEGKLCF